MILSLLWLLIPLLLSPTSFAHAYLDPGTGSYIIQIAIGAIFGISYALRTFIGKFYRNIRDRFKKENK